jgi:predicted PurR-regulated permease PerM
MARTNDSPTEESRLIIPDFLQLFRGPIDIRSVALTGIFLLFTLYSFYFARDFLLPVVLVFVLSALLAPAVRWLNRIHVPAMLGAGIVMAGILTVSVYVIYRLSEPAVQWIQKAPTSFDTVRRKLRGIVAPMEKARQTTAQIEKMTDLTKAKDVTTVEIKKPSLDEFVFTGARNFLVMCGVTIILLYFFLASGDLFLLKLVRVLPTLDDKKRAVEIYRQIERDISIYLWTITIINAGLGIAVGTTMYFLGMPNPALWGFLAAVLNYIPYLGATIGITTVGLASALSFDEPLRIILAPSVYFLFSVLEGNFLMPMAVGRSLALNPVVIFIWLIFWGWVWGIVGAVLAVPLLAILKIICDHFTSLSPVSEFLVKESKTALV